MTIDKLNGSSINVTTTNPFCDKTMKRGATYDGESLFKERRLLRL